MKPTYQCCRGRPAEDMALLPLQAMWMGCAEGSESVPRGVGQAPPLSHCISVRGPTCPDFRQSHQARPWGEGTTSWTPAKALPHGSQGLMVIDGYAKDMLLSLEVPTVRVLYILLHSLSLHRTMSYCLLLFALWWQLQS